MPETRLIGVPNSERDQQWESRLGIFWEEERQTCSHQSDVEEARWECLTEKTYQPHGIT